MRDWSTPVLPSPSILKHIKRSLVNQRYVGIGRIESRENAQVDEEEGDGVQDMSERELCKKPR